MTTVRLTMAQALVRYLGVQHVERDGVRQPLFGGCFGIFGHGNVAGLGEALQTQATLRYVPFRNEQAMVHAAVAYARQRNRLGVCACTSSVGPGATNMITGAALATINRLPVLLLPGDVFARRNVAPVLQQLEWEHSADVSVNDCFRPVSRYWDRLQRPEQLIWALPEALRVLTSPADTGAVTLALPQDVQAEAWDYPAGLFEPRVWWVPRQRPDREALERAAALLRGAQRPLLVAGGGVVYSDACETLAAFVEATGVPCALTQAGKGALPDRHALCVGAVGATGTAAANKLARRADVVLGVGTRYSDFTTASKTQFADPDVRFVNINVAEIDSGKHGGLALLGDAQVTLQELAHALQGWRVPAAHGARVIELRAAWEHERDRVCRGDAGAPLCQAQVIGLLDERARPADVVINAAGSAPGDLHKLWRAQGPRTYHVEYGYSCMGYEIPAGLGVRMAGALGRVLVLIGDGSYLMLSQDLLTAVQEHLKLTVVLLDNRGFASIGGLSEALGSGGFGTELRGRGAAGQLTGPHLLPDLAANAASLGAHVLRAATLGELKEALDAADSYPGTVVVVVPVDREQRVPGYESWWDVPVAEVSTSPSVRAAHAEHERWVAHERCYHAELGVRPSADVDPDAGVRPNADVAPGAGVGPGELP